MSETSQYGPHHRYDPKDQTKGSQNNQKKFGLIKEMQPNYNNLGS